MISQVKAFMRLNVLQAVRDRFFLGIVVFFVFFLGAAAFLSLLSVGHSAEVLRSMALAGIEYTTVLLVAVSIAFGFSQEKDTRIIDVYLSQFSRAAYISGKVLGYMVLSCIYVLLCALVSALLLRMHNAFTPWFLAAFYPLWLKICLVIVLSCFCSVFFSSPVMVLLTVLFLCLSGEGLTSAGQIVFLHGTAVQKAVVRVVSWILPRMDLLRAGKGTFSPGYFLGMTGYVMSYVVWIWTLTVLLFRKKDL